MGTPAGGESPHREHLSWDSAPSPALVAFCARGGAQAAASTALRIGYVQTADLGQDEAPEWAAVAQVSWETQPHQESIQSITSCPHCWAWGGGREGGSGTSAGPGQGAGNTTHIVPLSRNHPRSQFIHTQFCKGTSDPGSLQPWFNPLARLWPSSDRPQVISRCCPSGDTARSIKSPVSL